MFTYEQKLALQETKIELPPSIMAKLVFVFKDGDRTRWDADNVAYWFQNGPVECPFAAGYHYIPGFSRYAIDTNGNVITVRTGKRRQWTNVTPAKENIRGGYKMMPAVDDFGRRKGLSRHRAMLLAFRPISEHPAAFVVNHLDGLGGNDNLENLAWCTYSENTAHAYEIGLYANKVVAVDVMRWETGEVYHFPSIEKARRYIGIGESKIHHRLMRSNAKKYRDGFRIKRAEEEWLPGEKWVGQTSYEKELVYLNPVTGVGGTAQNATVASIVTGVPASTIRMHCRMKPKIPTNSFLFRYIDDFCIWPNYTDDELEVLKAHPENPADGIAVRDLETNSTMLFTSAREAGAYFGISPVTAGKLARYEGTRQARFQFKLVKVRKDF